MKVFVSLILGSIYFSEALLLPFNSSILRLPSQDAVPAIGETGTNKSLKDNPWPSPPFQREIKNGLSIRITAYGDLLTNRYTHNVLEALLPIQRVVRDAGELDDVLEETTTIGKFEGLVYTEVGFYSLHPPAGIKRSQAVDVLFKVWQLVIEYSPAREITFSTILVEGRELALFRLSFRRV